VTRSRLAQLGRRALSVRRPPPAAPAPSERQRALAELAEEDRRLIEPALPYTMTSVARMQALVDGVRYCVARDIPGAFVECGVWRGGSVLTMLLTLIDLGEYERDVYLFDTFEGMTLPTENDVALDDESALATWKAAERSKQQPWADEFGPQMFSEAQVREVVLATGYPAERIHFVRGPVEETIPDQGPGPIALLRLDTDWYESTRHELEHLYPCLAAGGVLIIDDYGHWKGARMAVDEYFSRVAKPILLNRIDYTGRIAVKP
jgi:O-methyltransferase